MKANRLRPLARIALGGLLVMLGASCSERKAMPPRVVTPAPAAPRPLPPPLPPPPSPAADWRDAPITPGTWRWAMEGGRSVARFGGEMLVLSCNRDAAAVTLMRPATAAGPVPVTILTSALNRTASASPEPGPPPTIALTLPARDSLLDAMAFSRGRFAVETAGLPALYLPSWPEVTRVVEDCR